MGRVGGAWLGVWVGGWGLVGVLGEVWWCGRLGGVSVGGGVVECGAVRWSVGRRAEW